MADEDPTGRLRACLETLEAVVEDRGLLAGLDERTRKRLVMAAGRVSRPDRAELRTLRKARQRLAREAARAADEAALSGTGIRVRRSAPVFATPAPLPPGTPPPHIAPEGAAPPRPLQDPRKCYVCKTSYTRSTPSTTRCARRARPSTGTSATRRPTCRARRARHRRPRQDRLPGRGQAPARRRRGRSSTRGSRATPRAGSRASASRRLWRDRLHVYGVDLRHTPSVEALFAATCSRRCPGSTRSSTTRARPCAGRPAATTPRRRRGPPLGACSSRRARSLARYEAPARDARRRGRRPALARSAARGSQAGVVAVGRAVPGRRCSPRISTRGGASTRRAGSIRTSSRSTCATSTRGG